MRKLAIVTTHPIQYNAPLFRFLNEGGDIACKVFYTWSQSEQPVYDAGFGIVRTWDIPLLEGYEYQFVTNTAKDPGLHRYKGIINPGLIEGVTNYHPDAILIFGWNYQSHLACLRHFKGKLPVIFRGDSTLLDEGSGFRRIIRRIFLTWVYRHIDYALYFGQNNKAYYRAHGIKDDQLVFAPHAVDNERFTSAAIKYEENAEMRRLDLGIKKDDLVLLFAGKLEEKKDPYFLLRLAKRIANPRLKFIIVGNGHLELSLKSRASGDSRFVFLEFQNQQSMPVIYRMADIFILPSVRNETWGLAINEAMVCKRPVIASCKVGCVPDLVTNAITGWVFEPGEMGEESIAIIINNILKNKELLIRMGENAFEKIQNYSYLAIKKGLVNLFAKIFH